MHVSPYRTGTLLKSRPRDSDKENLREPAAGLGGYCTKVQCSTVHTDIWLWLQPSFLTAGRAPVTGVNREAAPSTSQASPHLSGTARLQKRRAAQHY